MIDPWYLANLVCPIDKGALTLDGDRLVSAAGRRYPVVDGMPVMLFEDTDYAIPAARRTLERAYHGIEDARAPDYHLESLALFPKHFPELLRLIEAGVTMPDPVATMIQLSTSGYGYRHLIGRLADYPIPRLALPPGEGRSLLDIGCNWGRWTIAAARLGYRPVGVDCTLGAVIAARRIATQLGLDARFVVADARHLPFREGSFDTAYSYSVLQHFSEADALSALGETARVLRAGGIAKIQMAAKWGIRSLQHQVKRGFEAPTGFGVRYYSVPRLKRMFVAQVGPTAIAADCYFGLGWQWSDYRFMRRSHRPILIASEALRRTSAVFPPMRLVADSVFCTATRQ